VCEPDQGGGGVGGQAAADLCFFQRTGPYPQISYYLLLCLGPGDVIVDLEGVWVSLYAEVVEGDPRIGFSNLF